jgi:branched-chain amino acid aminotransferase
MNLTIPTRIPTWSFIDGGWHEGNVGILGPLSHAIWQGSSVFDGARAIGGHLPDLDLHLSRVNRSAAVLGLQATVAIGNMTDLVKDGLTRFRGDTAIYIRPMYWAEHPGPSGVSPDPTSTRFCLCLHEAPLNPPDGVSLGISKFRRPTIETMPTDAKTGSLYPNNARAIREVQLRGFDNAIVLDLLGNVAETATSNLFMVKNGNVFTPVANGCFLAGITRARVIWLLRDAGYSVEEKTLSIFDFLDADEIFTTGNYMKVVSVTRLEDRRLPVGPIGATAKKLYWDWAFATG